MESILSRSIGAEKDIIVGNGAILGWDRSPKRMWPTLARGDNSVAWGFSVICGQDILESGGRWSGIVTKRNEKGMWMKVSTSMSNDNFLFGIIRMHKMCIFVTLKCHLIF